MVRPESSDWSLEALWALCNSPFTNAYTFAHSAKKHIMAGFLREMPVPKLRRRELIPLETAVRAYLADARDFSASKDNSTKPKRRGEKALANAADHAQQLPLDGLSAAQRESNENARQRLRALHWRVDAEILKLYSLPAPLERELLDFFDGARRVGVPFEQTRYIPLEFREVQRLDDYLRITDEWEQTDERRCELIEKQIKHGRRTTSEEAEFQELQRLYDLRRSYQRWLRTGDANSPLFDEAKLRRLKEEDTRRPHDE